MSEHTPTPKLVMGHIEIVANGKTSVPDDDAVIHIDGDEDSEIEVHFPNALQLAPFIVKAVNSHDDLVDCLKWLDRKGGLGLDVHERIRGLLASVTEPT